MDTLTADWLNTLDECMRSEVLFACDYAQNYDHGTSGHLGYSTLAKLAEMLDMAMAQLGDKFGPGQQSGRFVLPVPYRSQWDKDAGLTTKDCGPACIGMLLDYKGTHVATDKIMTFITKGVNRPTSFTELQRAAGELGGVALERKTNWTWDGLIEALRNGRPSMVLIKNGYNVLRLDRNNTTGHFMVPVGFDVIPFGSQQVERVICHDPNWWTIHTAQGAFLPIIKDDFMKMWTGAQEDWNNPARAALVLSNE